jgi:hypothetical protein
MKKASLTFDEAQHLVKRHLGLTYVMVRSGGWWHIFDRTELKFSGLTLLEAVEDAGIEVPEEEATETLEFAVVGSKVMRGSERICDARSSNFANRIANALNKHKPDRRGQ